MYISGPQVYLLSIVLSYLTEDSTLAHLGAAGGHLNASLRDAVRHHRLHLRACVSAAHRRLRAIVAHLRRRLRALLSCLRRAAGGHRILVQRPQASQYAVRHPLQRSVGARRRVRTLEERDDGAPCVGRSHGSRGRGWQGRHRLRVSCRRAWWCAFFGCLPSGKGQRQPALRQWARKGAACRSL